MALKCQGWEMFLGASAPHRGTDTRFYTMETSVINAVFGDKNFFGIV